MITIKFQNKNTKNYKFKIKLTYKHFKNKKMNIKIK